MRWGSPAHPTGHRAVHLLRSTDEEQRLPASAQCCVAPLLVAAHTGAGKLVGRDQKVIPRPACVRIGDPGGVEEIAIEEEQVRIHSEQQGPQRP